MTAHRWHSNENAVIKPFGLHDKCVVCGVRRYDYGLDEHALRSNAVAAIPCPGKPWREMSEDEIESAVAEYQSED